MKKVKVIKNIGYKSRIEVGKEGDTFELKKDINGDLYFIEKCGDVKFIRNSLDEQIIYEQDCKTIIQIVDIKCEEVKNTKKVNDFIKTLKKMIKYVIIIFFTKKDIKKLYKFIYKKK